MKRTAPAGFELAGDGSPGTLAAFALAPHHHQEGEIFSEVEFADPKALKSPNTVYTGVPFGSQTLLSDGIYVPRVALTNFSKQPAHVTIEMSSSPPQAAEDGTETAEAITSRVLHVRLAAGESKEAPIAIDSDSGGLQHSVIVKSDRPSGEVQSKLVSRSDGRLFEVEMLGRDEKATDNAGGHPWLVQEGTESNLFLFNHSASAMIFGVSISNGLQIWNKRYEVAPFATRQLSINQILNDQVKDDKGHTLDVRYHEGVVAWSTADAGKAKGRLLVSNRATAMARTFSCYTTQVICALHLSVYDQGLIAIDNYIDYADAVPAYCYPPQQGSCSGTQAGGGGATFGWTLGNTNIVNFNTAGDKTSQNPNLRGVAAGSTSATVTAYLNGCQSVGGGNPPPTVQVPTALQVVHTTSNAAASCPSKQAGWQRVVTRVVVDQNALPIKVDEQSVAETVTLNPGQAGLGSGPIKTGTGTTDQNGQYPDTFSICSTACPGGSNSTNTATQTNTDTLPNNGGSYSLTNSTIQYACTYIKINGSLTP